MADLSTVTFSSKDPNVTVQALLDEEQHSQSGGIAIWSEFERPTRKSGTEASGSSPKRLTIPIIFDGFATGTSQESLIAKIERLSKIAEGDIRSPIVKIQGPLPGRNLEWVIDGLDWGIVERDPNTFARTRQRMTVSLLEFVEAEIVLTTKPKKGSGTWSLYKVMPGDTLPKIAAARLKKAKRWREIAKLNSLRSPQIPARLVGKKIRVPKR